jgi:integrase
VKAVKSARFSSRKIPLNDQIEYPHFVTKGSVRVAVYRVKNAARGDVFEVTWFQAGTRKRNTFRDETEALDHADGVVKSLDKGQGDGATLTSVEAQSFRLAKSALSGIPDAPPLHSAVGEYVAARKLLGRASLLGTLRDWFTEKSAAELKPIQAPELVREFLAAKRADGLSERYLKDCEFRLGRFGKDFQTEVSRIKSSELDVWLRSMKVAGRSRNNFRTLLVTLTEAEHVARAKDRGGQIEIFTPDEIQRLLNNAGDEVLPYLALGAFAGVRTAEIVRLTWDCIRWNQKVIEVRAGMAKTSQRRLVPLSDNLAQCLKKLAKPHGPIVTLARPEKTASEVVAASCDPVIKWKRNGLRHSYASYRLAILNDAGKLALEMGNSPNMIFRHYRELVISEDAKAWFELVPQPLPNQGEEEDQGE